MDADDKDDDLFAEGNKELVVGRTMKAAYRATLEGNRFYPKAGEIIEMQIVTGSMTLASRKVMLLLLQKAGGDAGENKVHRITKKELRGSHESNDRIDDIFDNLMNVKVKMRTTSSRNRAAIITSPLIEWNIEEGSDDGMSVVEYRFSDVARRAMLGSDYYAKIRVAVAMAFQSKYAMALYELGTLYLNRREPVWKCTVDDFRGFLGLSSKIYSNFAQLRREVLAKSKAEIDQLADFVIDWQEIRGDGRGRPVKSLVLSFRPKDASLIDAAAEELDRPKVGRIARRDGTVEDIVELPKVVAIQDGHLFPQTSLHFGGDPRINQIAVDFGGGWDRDMIADEYRRMMGDKLKTLRGPALLRSFEGFCKRLVETRGRA